MHSSRWRVGSSQSQLLDTRGPGPLQRPGGAPTAPRGRDHAYLVRAQSVPKRNGTNRLLVARRGTNGRVKWYTNRLTSPLSSSGNAEADGSIPSSPTKDLMKKYFWSCEYKHPNAEVDRLAYNDNPAGQRASGRPVDDLGRDVVATTCPKRAQGPSRAEVAAARTRRASD